MKTTMRSPVGEWANDLPLRILCGSFLLLLAACASTGEQVPLEVRITQQGYEVDGLALATAQQVAESIGRRGVRHVRPVLDQDASAQQVEKAVSALQEAGAALGIVGDVPEKK